MSPILTRPVSDRRHHLEEAGALLRGCLNQLWAGHSRLNVAIGHEISRSDAFEICGCDLEQTLLEHLPLRAREPRELIAGLAATLDIGRFQRVDIAARAEDRFLQGL